MSSLNKVIIIGRLGRDPELRYLPSGKAVANIAVATSEKFKDKQGQQQEHTEWFNVSMFDRLAEIAGEYLKKGSLVYLEGRQRTEKWKDNDGNDRTSVKLLANQMQMLSPASEKTAAQAQGQQPPQNNQGQQGGYNQGQRSQINGQGQQSNYNKQQPDPKQQNQSSMSEPDFDFDDDIPF